MWPLLISPGPVFNYEISVPYVRCQHSAPNVWDLQPSQILHQDLRFVNFPVQNWPPHQGPRGTCKYLPRGDSCPWSKRIKRPMGPRLPWKLVKRRQAYRSRKWWNSQGWVRLVGGWTNPFEKYWSNWIISPGFGVNIKNIWNHHLEESLGKYVMNWFWKH